ncbi:hypothetical protein GL50803_002549 [Giardia duodenalis]|uniref:Uncharacterized protein n=1 Tax=Giardia intestinalis (strain ATCC 50803 / WB clone C6) TaxID=184922 RepID=D3KHW0_GIAIC|nr:hypothetical protein GL50803_002549 [Giardia intestinalis]KAE8305983.1 hypothetical protein GL50803_002549 [Giardia intestinalis]
MLTFTGLLITANFLLSVVILTLFTINRDGFFAISLLGEISADSLAAVGERYNLVHINTNYILQGLAYYAGRHKISVDDNRLRYLMSSFDRACTFTLTRDTFVLSCGDHPIAQKALRDQMTLMSTEMECLKNSQALYTYSKGLVAALSQQAKRAGYKGVLCTGVLCSSQTILRSDLILYLDYGRDSDSKRERSEMVLPPGAIFIAGETEAQVLGRIFDELNRSKAVRREKMRRFTVIHPRMASHIH